MRIAHVSDLHAFSLEGVPLRRFLNKRLTGWANLRLHRGAVHHGRYVAAIVDELARHAVDHVVITGDLTNLALEGEFELAREWIERIPLDPSHVTIVPGNHDLYTRGARATRRFEHYFGPWLQSDLPDASVDVSGARFPVVKLADDVAIVGVSTAVPQPPLVAAGTVGQAQLRALARALEHPEVARRALVLALHHPVEHEWKTWLKGQTEGLRDAPALLRLLRAAPPGLVVHGHLHRRVQRPLAATDGRLTQVGSTSASLHHESSDRMAGFNVYEIGGDAPPKVEAHVYHPATDTFEATDVPAASR